MCRTRGSVTFVALNLEGDSVSFILHYIISLTLSAVNHLMSNQVSIFLSRVVEPLRKILSFTDSVRYLLLLWLKVSPSPFI